MEEKEEEIFIIEDGDDSGGDDLQKNIMKQVRSIDEAIKELKSDDIKKPRVFCGNGDNVPHGYDRLGTRYECLRKGFGAGVYLVPEKKRQQMLAKKRKRPLSYNNLQQIGMILGIENVEISKTELVKNILKELDKISAEI